MLDWTREVDTHEAYIAALDFVIKFYSSNSNFRQDVARSTAKVLGKDTASSDESESGNIDFFLFRFLFLSLSLSLFFFLFFFLYLRPF